MDASTGPVIGHLGLPVTGGTGKFVEVKIPLQHSVGRHDLFFVAANPDATPEPICRLDWVAFHQ